MLREFHHHGYNAAEMKIIRGNLLSLGIDGAFDVIVHGCNCHHSMGAGIAKSIKEEFPEAYAADLETEEGSREKLGSITSASIDRGGHTLNVVNAYTQYDWSGLGVKVDYVAIRSVFQAVKEQFAGQRIGYPKIGAGLGGGDWKIISAIIDEELAGEDHTLVEFVP